MTRRNWAPRRVGREGDDAPPGCDDDTPGATEGDSPGPGTDPVATGGVVELRTGKG
ncbi:MAG: hypothetical protein ACK5F7_04925 [Planctomycetaceae bacterium]